MTEWSWLEGLISIEAAVRGQSRELQAIFVEKGRVANHKIRRFLQTAEYKQISIHHVPDTFIADRAEGKSHGGIIAQVGPRRFVPLAELTAENENPAIFMLDGIEDPFNFGQAIRVLYASGVSGVVVRPRNWLSAAGVVARSSAGASELMKIAVADTPTGAAAFFRDRGLKIAGTTEKRSQSIYKTDLTGPLFILIGGEKRGITRSFLKEADLRLQIPYGREFSRSLGTAAAAAIIGFELMRQRFSVSD